MHGEGHVRIDVPILHALDDVNRALVVLKGPIKEGALGPVIVAAVGHHAAGEVGGGAIGVAFEVAFAQRVAVLAVAVDAERAVHAVVHDHATRFHAAVAPHEVVDADQTRHGHDGREVRVAEGGRLPRRAAVVGLADEPDASVGPSLRTEPRHCSVDAALFVGAHEVHAVVGFTGAKHRDLGHSIAMGHVVLDEEATQAIGWRHCADVAVVVVGTHVSDDRHAAVLGDVLQRPVTALDDGQPEAEVNLCVAGQAGSAVGGGDGVHGNEHRNGLRNTVGAVDGDTAEHVAVVVDKIASLPRIRIGLRAFVHWSNVVVCAEAARQRHGEHQPYKHERDVPHGQRLRPVQLEHDGSPQHSEPSFFSSGARMVGASCDAEAA